MASTLISTAHLDFLSKEIYTPCGWVIDNLYLSTESTEYHACTYQLNQLAIIGRMAKNTPKKIGQFVTLWKRNILGITSPYNEEDKMDLCVINVQLDNQFGQFIFPKTLLLHQGIISTAKKEGKRGFRVYPPWDRPDNKTAQNTQNWQLDYFLRIKSNIKTDLHRANKLYAHNNVTAD
ncbi:MepB family protein [Arenibacter certesii]|uniref:MepB family protein n=1 Tax=Arenibacter certesii TaxID=228955 RepID=A0A918IUH5_9FLAO|nr:MepB family protein [Arenibacter certesii]GGW32355.1 hypothetical protein GCM10007383_16790 [Arenibacter certesii]